MAVFTQNEIGSFLGEPRIGHLVTVRAAGTPHVAPVWFLWDGDKAWVIADAQAVKIRNIRNNPDVALSVATSERPFAYVVVEGQASVTSAGVEAMVNRLCVKYDGPERGPAYAEELLAESRLVLIEITVARIMSWVED